MDIKKILEEQIEVKPTQKQEDVAGKVLGLFNQLLFEKNLPLVSKLYRKSCWQEDLEKGEDDPQICVALNDEKYDILYTYVFYPMEDLIEKGIENAPLYISIVCDDLGLDLDFAYADMLTKYKPALEDACTKLAELYEGK